MRFRKSFKLAPGIRLNMSGSGFSWTLGPRGASVGIGKRGTFFNTGIPGTGLYSRERIGNSTASSARHTSGKVKVEVVVSVNDDGTVCFHDSSGNVVAESTIRAAKRQQGDAIKELIKKKCDEINNQIEALGLIHIHTLPPDTRHQYVIKPFTVLKPSMSTPKKPGFIAFFFQKDARTHYPGK